VRTTLDIDDDVLRAAKELARREKKTAGAVGRRTWRARRSRAARSSVVARGSEPVLPGPS